MPIHEIVQTKGVPIRVYTDQFDDKTRKQLIDLAESGIVEEFVAAMPDVHYGMGATIGSVFASSWAVCPNAVGVDIGCGMAALPFPDLKRDMISTEVLWEIHRTIKERIPTGTMVHQRDQWAPVLDDQDRSAWLGSQINNRAVRSLGTLGGGNHFIEVVYDEYDKVWAMLHSGSRNLGKVTADRYNELAKAQMTARGMKGANSDLNYLLIESEEGRDYLRDMTWCQRFALANRQSMLETIGRIVRETTNAEADWNGMVNIHHNFCSCEHCSYQNSAGDWVERELWITRKGATSARDGQRGLIPGSMAVGSWLVEGQGNWQSWYSCSHGAGRRKSRTASFAEIDQADFERSMQGIVAETVPELRDEAPQAYKDLGTVMKWQSDLVTPVNRLLPLLNVKGWDKGGGSPWNMPKAPVRFEASEQLAISVSGVLVNSAGDDGRQQSHWVEADVYTQRSDPTAVGTIREIWVRTSDDPDHELLVICTVMKVSAEGISVRTESVKKKLRIK